MTLKECLLIANGCYREGTLMIPKGIIVHSTGAANNQLRRYVQPLKSQSYYQSVINDLGKNSYDNDWNHYYVENGQSMCMHAFIGLNAAGKVETYQTLPFGLCAWGCGRGSKGSYNFEPYGHIQFEICEDNLDNESYFNSAFTEAIQFCAYLCERFDLSNESIISHKEAHKLGYASDHGDCDYWLAKHNKTMNWFRSEVAKAMGKDPATPTKTIDELAKEVLAGKWGNGSARKNALIAAGYDYYAIQNRINEILYS